MFFQLIYPDNKDTCITAFFAWGYNMYWKASDIFKMFYFTTANNPLKKYLPNEYVFRYENDNENDYGNVTIFLDSVQVLRFMDNIPPPKHQNYSFKRWFRNVIDGTQTFYSNTDLSEFSKFLNYPGNGNTITIESVLNDKYNITDSNLTTDTIGDSLIEKDDPFKAFPDYVYTLPEIISNIRKRNLPYKMQSIT